MRTWPKHTHIALWGCSSIAANNAVYDLLKTVNLLGGHIMVQQTAIVDSELEEMHIKLTKVLGELKHSRRRQILESLPTGTTKTFEELKEETGISTGSLHHHLSELCEAGLIARDQESWPRKYKQSDFLKRLINSVGNN
jgi:DNA-binding HxlR family transcriptional regulator